MPHKPRIYIVEDQGLTRLALIKVLESNGYEVVGTSSTAEKAWLELQEKKADVVLLDFNLKGTKKGLWLAEKINLSIKIPIVFLTAYGSQEFLNKLFDVNIAGYIMKPFNNPTLLSAIKLAIDNQLSTSNNKKFESEVFLKTKSGSVKFTPKNIYYLQSKKNDIKIYTIDKTYLTRDKLENLLIQLNFRELYRIHRRFAVNINYVSRIEGDKVYIGKTEIPMSKSYDAEALIKNCHNNQ